MESCGGLATRRSAGCQAAGSLPSCPTKDLMAAALPSKRIPESGAKVVEGLAARWVRDQIRAAQQIKRQVHGLRQGNSQPGTGLHEIRPILALGVDGDVAVPVELHRAEIVSGAGLRVDQKIVIETAHEKRIQGGLGQPGATLDRK